MSGTNVARKTSREKIREKEAVEEKRHGEVLDNLALIVTELEASNGNLNDVESQVMNVLAGMPEIEKRIGFVATNTGLTSMDLTTIKKLLEELIDVVRNANDQHQRFSATNAKLSQLIQRQILASVIILDICAVVGLAIAFWT